MDNSKIDRQDWHGILSNPTFARERLITITGTVFSETRATRGTAKDQISAIFPLSTNPTQGGDFYDLSFTDDDGTEKFFEAKVYNPPAFTHAQGDPIYSFVCELICQKPFIFSKNKVSQTVNYGLYGGVVLPTVLPIPFDGYLNLMTISNSGTFGSPIEITVTGSIINPKILHLESGKFFKLDRTLTNETLLVNSDPGTATISGASVLSDRASGSSFLYANPGSNHFLLMGDDFDVDN